MEINKHEQQAESFEKKSRNRRLIALGAIGLATGAGIRLAYDVVGGDTGTVASDEFIAGAALLTAIIPLHISRSYAAMAASERNLAGQQGPDIVE